MARPSIIFAPAVQKQVRLPAPVKGNNTLDNVLAIGPEYTYVCNNFVARPYGIEIRKGYREWLPHGVSLPGAAATLMNYMSPDGASVFLFAATDDVANSVYNISSPNTALGTPLPLVPTPSPPVYSFQAEAGAVVAGEWSWLSFHMPSITHLCAVLHGRGYYTFTSADGWRKVPVEMTNKATLPTLPAGTIRFEYNGVVYNSDTMMFVFSWKSRLWFLQANTALAWYLPVNQYAGEAEAIDLGQFLAHGGGMSHAMSWTYDSGSGMDDGLIFVGNNGDMVIYQGTDPSDAAKFSLKGTWFIGRIPKGRRSFVDYGGDVLIVTEYGINSVSDFVSGRLVNLEGQSSVAEKYNPTLARTVSNFIGDRYWQLVNYPAEEFIILLSPATRLDTQERVSFVMSHFGKGWNTLTIMEPYCALVHEGQFIFSDRLGKVYQGFYGYQDNTSFDESVVGSEVVGQFQTGFFDYGSPNSNKRAQRVRILGQADGLPAYVLAMEPEYNLSNLPNVGAPSINTGALWDVALWDQAMWQSKAGYWAKWFGVACFGKRLSLQAAIRGTGYTLVTDYEVTYEEGIGL